MNRYIVVDLEENVIYDTNDLSNIVFDKFDRYGSSISCLDMEDTINELENIVEELKEMNQNDK